MKTKGVLLSSVLLAACGAGPLPVTATFTSLDGTDLRPLSVPPRGLHVLVFVSHDCPIANSYAPEIAALSRDFARDGVRLLLVHVDPQLTAAAARAHQLDYALPDPILLDPHQVLPRAVGATITPEAAVVDASGVRYLGRIDDQWSDLGSRRIAPLHRDLRQAVADLVAGNPVSVPRTTAVGCLLPEPR